MHHSFGFGNLIIATGECDQLTLPSRRAENLVDPLAVIGDQSVSGLKDRCGGAVVLLQLHHGASDIIRRLIAKIVLKPHQDREIRRTKAVNALVCITHHKHRPSGPVVIDLWIFAIGHQQLDQFILRAVGVLILVHQNVGKAAMPIATDLLVLLKQLDRQEQ